ncbi:DUF6731 family protein [Bacillus sp. NP247]|uniref:DUF6731 family protein n=1 Tax=Bacillus sp. NP247 TaxID=2846779 RepID=UPI001C628720|nr:DUF6731 family protein [Bacillus sp. NP247]QWU46401.1 hypothetical protein KPL75_05540 [Bacillus sp. NP247]
MKKYAYLYNCYITLNGKRTDLAIDDFLDKIIPLSAQNRQRTIKGIDYISKAMMPEINSSKSRNRQIGFGKYRDHKPYEAKKGTDLAELIKKDILEMSSALFVPTQKLLIVEYNHYGPRINSIAQYLSSFLPKNANNTWDIEILPVETNLGWADIAKSDDIRQIEIKLDIAGKSKHFISKMNKPQSLLGKLIRETVETHSQFGANTAKLSFGNGRKKVGIQSEQLLSLLELLAYEESELFETVKIKYKSDSTGRMEEVDLKHDGVKSMFLKNVDKNNNWEYICDEISNEYYEDREPASSNFSKHAPFKSIKFPGIII